MNKQLHVSIDLETLSTEHYPVILSIGLVIFKLGDVNKIITDYSYVANSNTQSPLASVTEATLAWWAAQEIARPSGQSSIKNVLRNIATDLQKVEYCWGHGTTFDLSGLLDSYKLHNIEPPKCLNNFYNWRDTRTWFAAAGFDYHTWRSDVISDSKRHNALVDAELQARGIIKAHKILTGEIF